MDSMEFIQVWSWERRENLHRLHDHATKMGTTNTPVMHTVWNMMKDLKNIEIVWFQKVLFNQCH